jgi:hypothetical protein
MAKECGVCLHPRRADIDAALLAGRSLRDIAGQFVTGKNPLARHKKDHISKTLSKAKEAAEEVEASNLFGRLKAINSELRQANRETLEVLTEAKAAKNGPLRLQAIQRLEKQAEVGARLLELEGKLLGELNDTDKASGRVVINVVVRKAGYPPDWSAADNGPVTVEMKPDGDPEPPPARSRFVPRIAGGIPRRDRT